VAGKKGALSWLDWRRSQDGRGPVSREDFDKAVVEATAEDCAQTGEAINQSLEELDQLRQRLDTRMGPSAPGLNALRQAITDCQTLMGHILPQKRPAIAAESDTLDEASPQTGVRAATSRAEAYRQLTQAAAVLQELEPHSPIPYLVRKAVELGSLSFPELIARLIRDEGVLTELNRELGIKPPDQQAS
jgi:type VI secretion system protein ImpA